MEDRHNLIRWSEIEPACVLGFVKSKLWMIILAVLTGVMAASIILSSLVVKTYSCATTFAVTARSSSSASTEYYNNTTAASEVVAIYSQLLKGKFINDLIAEDLGKGDFGTISTSQLGKTNLIQVTVTSRSPRNSLLIMQSVLKNYTKLSEYVNSTSVLSPMSTSNMTIRTQGNYNRNRIMILAGCGSGLAMAALLSWISISAGTIQNRASANNNLDAKVIASVPHENRRGFGKKRRSRSALNITSHNVSFVFAESINKISARFELENSHGKSVFLFSSVSEAEGKSTLAANTALSLALAGRKVLFIDLDLRHPVQSDMLDVNVSQRQSFGSLLASGASAEEFLNEVIVDKSSGLNSLLSDRSYTDMIELISSPQLEKLLARAREIYDFVVIDSPPLGYFTDSELLSDLCDGTVLVVRQDIVPAPEINDAIDALRDCRAEFLGVILNDMRHMNIALLGGNREGYGYGYGYGYGKYKYGYGSSKKSSK